MLPRYALRLLCTALLAASPIACDGGSPPSSGTTASPTGAAAATTTAASPAAPGKAAAAPTAATPPAAGPCVPCKTQEDFDAAQAKQQTCCPVRACSGDSECSGGRVCCRIPKGQLCADAARCAKGDRVGVEGGACTRSKDCAGNQICCASGSTGSCSAPNACQNGLLRKADLDCQLATMAPDVRAKQKCVGNHCTF